MSLQHRFLSFYGGIRYFLKGQKIKFDAAGVHLLADTQMPKNVQNFQFLVSLSLTSMTHNYIVEKAMKNLKRLPNFDAYHISKMEESQFSQYLDGVTYSGKKTKFIKKMANMILYVYSNEVPTDPKEIIKLPGIGKVSCDLFIKRQKNLETQHIELTPKTLLFLERVQLVLPEQLHDDTQLQIYLQSFIDPILWSTLHIPIDLFVDHVCLQSTPKCAECPLRDKCPSFNSFKHS